MEPTGSLAPLWRVLVRPWADPRYLDRRFERDGVCVRYRQFGREVVAVGVDPGSSPPAGGWRSAAGACASV